MRNGLVQLGAWAAATGAAVALSWFGVHAVLTGAAFERPTALPLPSPASAVVPSVSSAPPAAPTAAPEASAGASPTHGAAVGSATQRAVPSTPAAPRRSATATTVRSYPVPGGRVALDIRPTSAELVSAVPDPGWQMQVWHGDQWMRIDFSKGDAANSVFVTWNGHEPDVQTVVR